MKNLQKRLNTLEDSRWEMFQKGARQRRIIIISLTLVVIILSFVFQSLWLFFALTTLFWLTLLIWRKLHR